MNSDRVRHTVSSVNSECETHQSFQCPELVSVRHTVHSDVQHFECDDITVSSVEQ